MLQAVIKAIEFHLPEEVLTNEQLALDYPDWSTDKIEQKTGIIARHIAADNECASDLAVKAVQKLFDSGACSPADVDYLVLCTQSPDYFLPTTACLLQERLGLRTSIGALDFNLGCSGYVYGLGLVKGLIETGQASKVLLVMAETYSKFIRADDRNVRTIFGDAAAATLIEGHEIDNGAPSIGPFVFGTDGRGAENLIVRSGGMRQPEPTETMSSEGLYMNGAEIFTFTIETVPKSVQEVLKRAGKTIDEVDLFVFHQANQYMLDHLRRKLKIPTEKFCISMAQCGNTVSATIPIAMKHALAEGKLKRGDLAMLVGFGVGYSWGATLVRWI